MSVPMRALGSFLRPAKSEPKPEPAKSERPRPVWAPAPLPMPKGIGHQPSPELQDRTARFRSAQRRSERAANKQRSEQRWAEYGRNLTAAENPLVGPSMQKERERERTEKQAKTRAKAEEKRPKLAERPKPKAEEGRFGGAQKPLLGVQFGRTREIDWNEYEKLDPRSQAAVQANTLLAEAIEKDRALKVSLDTNRDGKVSVAEAGDEANGYRDLVERRFGAREGWDDDRIRFAPHTAGALELLNIEDRKGSVEDFYGRQVMVTAQDLERGTHLRDPNEYGPRRADPRRDALSMMTNNMDGLNRALADGRAYIDGIQSPVTTEGGGADRFEQLVISLRRGIGEGATFDSLFDGTSEAPRFNMDSLKDEGIVQLRDDMEGLYKMLVGAGASEDALVDKNYIGGILSQFGEGYTFDAWTKMMDDRKRVLEEGIRIGGKTIQHRATEPVGRTELFTSYEPDQSVTDVEDDEEEE